MKGNRLKGYAARRECPRGINGVPAHLMNVVAQGMAMNYRSEEFYARIWRPQRQFMVTFLR